MRTLAHKSLFYYFAPLSITEGTVNGKTRSRDLTFINDEQGDSHFVTCILKADLF